MVNEELLKMGQKRTVISNNFGMLVSFGGAIMSQSSSAHLLCHLLLENWKLRLVDLPSTATLGFGLNPVAELIPVAAANPMP